MPDTTPEQRIRALLDAQVQCTLATQGDTAPAIHLMAYAPSNDLASIFVASPQDTNKVLNMRQRPNVALLWDNRTGLLADHVQGTVLTAQAKATELTRDGDGEGHRGAAIRGTAIRGAAIAALEARNTSLSELLAAATTAIFQLTVDRYSIGTGYNSHDTYVPQHGAT